MLCSIVYSVPGICLSGKRRPVYTTGSLPSLTSNMHPYLTQHAKVTSNIRFSDVNLPPNLWMWNVVRGRIRKHI